MAKVISLPYTVLVPIFVVQRGVPMDPIYEWDDLPVSEDHPGSNGQFSVAFHGRLMGWNEI